MIKFTVESRKRAIRDILVDIKGKLDEASNDAYSVEFYEDHNWIGNEFKYIFKIILPKCTLSDNYDSYVEAADFAQRMFTYVINSDSADLTMCEGIDGLEVEIVGRTNHD